MSQKSIAAVFAALGVAAAMPAAAVEVRAVVNIDASNIQAIGGVISAVGPAAPAVDFSGTDVSLLGGANVFDQSSFMNNDCNVGIAICDLVRLRIGGLMNIDTTAGFGIVAPKIEPQDVATFIFSAAGTLQLRLDLDVIWTEDTVSPLAGRGIARYDIGQWRVTGTDGFSFGPTLESASGDLAIGNVVSFELAAGTYRLFSPSVSVFLCAVSPADTSCNATEVPAPASMALLASALAGLLGFQMRRAPTRVAALHRSR